MIYRLLADAVVLFHLCFITFVVLGALLVVRWPRVAWLHLPALAWGILVEANNWACPLTPLENHLRKRAAAAQYSGGFIEHYVRHVIYLPEDLLRRIQVLLVCVIVTISLGAYAYTIYARTRMASRGRSLGAGRAVLHDGEHIQVGPAEAD